MAYDEYITHASQMVRTNVAVCETVYEVQADSISAFRAFNSYQESSHGGRNNNTTVCIVFTSVRLASFDKLACHFSK